MGKITVRIKLTNYVEEQMKRLKLLKGKPSSMETEAPADTGATRLYVQSSVILAEASRQQRLNRRQFVRQTRLPSGVAPLQVRLQELVVGVL